MNITLERDALLRALNHAAAVVEKRVTIPVLSNVQLDASGGECRIVATDLEIQVAVTLKAEIISAGATTVAAQLLANIVRELDEGSQVALTLENDRLRVASGRSKYHLPTLPATDFPLMKPAEPIAEFTMECADMARAFKSVAYAQAVEETLFYLTGVHLDVRDGKLTFAATNRHIMASTWRTAPDGSDGLKSGITLPRKLVGELIRMLDAAEGEIAVSASGALVRLRLGDIDVLAKLVDGEYPDWRRAIPKDHPATLKVRAGALAAAVRRAVLVAEDKTRSVRADIGTDLVRVSSRGALSGTAEEELPCGYDAAEFAVGLNSRYVLDTIDAIGADELECAVDPASSSTNAAAVLLTSPARPDGQWLIMPMRV